jgi:hypothetical protein
MSSNKLLLTDINKSIFYEFIIKIKIEISNILIFRNNKNINQKQSLINGIHKMCRTID